MADLRIIPSESAPRAISPVRFPELAPKGESFGTALGQAVADVESLQLKAQDAAVALAAGRAQDTAQSVATIEKANVAFQFALQIRNKLLEAYQDVMRMPV
jgi:flagellar hook-basal body complex protein FliE